MADIKVLSGNTVEVPKWLIDLIAVYGSRKCDQDLVLALWVASHRINEEMERLKPPE